MTGSDSGVPWADTPTRMYVRSSAPVQQKGTESEAETYAAPRPLEPAGLAVGILQGDQSSVKAAQSREHEPSALAPEYPYEFGTVPAHMILSGQEHVHFQRPFRLRHARKMIREYNPLLMDPLVVNVREDNEPYLLRGQHRLYALKELFGPDTLVRCRIYYGLSPEQEALVFVAEDTARKIASPAERWRAALDAKWSPYVEIEQLARNAGWVVSPTGGSPNAIRAVGALLDSWNYGRGRSLYDALRLLRMAGWTDEPPASSVITGLTRFVSMYQDQLPGPVKVAEFLRKLGYVKLKNVAEQRRLVDKLNAPQAVLITLEREWNFKKSANRLTPIDPDAIRTRRGQAGSAARWPEGQS